jgi:hypothetical protein
MEDLIINGKVIKFINPDQIINMGGPWVGELMIGDDKIMDNVIIDNTIYDVHQNRLYIVKYFNLSKWQHKNYFSICYLDLFTDKIYVIDLKFEMIFIKEIYSSNELIYYEAFHDQDEKVKKKLNLETIRKYLY